MPLRNAARAVRAVRGLFDGPLARPVLPQWTVEHFLSGQGAGFHYGVFGTFEQARAWLPASKEFENAALATEYLASRARRISTYDYPVLLWLLRAIQGDATSVLDIGGSVGVHYYAYRRHIQFPAALTWRVVEVPTMAAIGRNLATTSAATALSFAEELTHAVMSVSSDIWLAAGALQYMEDARPRELLKRCFERPKHLLLNKLPLYEGDDFVTTQNIGSGSFAPLHVFNRRRLIEEIQALGYSLRDKWLVPEHSLYLPGHPERSLSCFTGLYFVDCHRLSIASRLTSAEAR
ncbi:methyltransferase, TIGR04325 family [Variovorax sp. J31P179]|uniref:methyltransferase, TIGR04325 family n=1 Tax=Variovorax sp. J31P179 TaxID=3053508 RepID=UPI002575450F|nr:methyltransferase, TIGR04325 family [Variovorax sp. J31P179]MDM0084953.1 methyltransferase, TIGR04325 family [Variovorax sp. J31P179]